MRLGFRLGPFYASTSPRRHRPSARQTTANQTGCLILLGIITVLCLIGLAVAFPPVAIALGIIAAIAAVAGCVWAIGAAEKGSPGRRNLDAQRLSLEAKRGALDAERSALEAKASAVRTDVLSGLEMGRDRVLAECPPGERRDALLGWFGYLIAATNDEMEARLVAAQYVGAKDDQRVGLSEAHARAEEAHARVAQAMHALRAWDNWTPPTQ